MLKFEDRFMLRHVISNMFLTVTKETSGIIVSVNDWRQNIEAIIQKKRNTSLALAYKGIIQNVNRDFLNEKVKLSYV